MRIVDILEAIGDADDIIEQLQYENASIINDLYRIIKQTSQNFTIPPDTRLKIAGARMFLYREDAIRALGNNSNTVRRINIILNYIQGI